MRLSVCHTHVVPKIEQIPLFGWKRRERASILSKLKSLRQPGGYHFWNRVSPRAERVDKLHHMPLDSVTLKIFNL